MQLVQSSARVPSVCATCRNPGALEVGQEVREGRLHWFERFSCGCGHGFEAGGVGLPAPGVRNSILAQSGHAEVWLDDADGRAPVVKVLVKLLGLNEGEAQQRVAKLPAVAYDGTHTEAAFIETALQRGGVKVRVLNHLPRKP